MRSSEESQRPPGSTAEHPLSDALVREIVQEFPTFTIRPKCTSTFQRCIHHALVAITLGGQRVYLTQYYTVLFGTLWVPASWDTLPDKDRYVLLRHERIHLRQRRRLGDVRMAFLYLVPIFPLFLAYGRARIEWEAYEETLRATADVYGIEQAKALREKIVRRFTGPDYGWMWPFPKAVHRWFDEALARLVESPSNPPRS